MGGGREVEGGEVGGGGGSLGRQVGVGVEVRGAGSGGRGFQLLITFVPHATVIV